MRCLVWFPPYRFLLLFRLFFCEGRDEDEGRDIYTVLATLVVYMMYTQYVPCGGAYLPPVRSLGYTAYMYTQYVPCGGASSPPPPPQTHGGCVGVPPQYACWARVLHVGVPPQSRKICVLGACTTDTHPTQAGWVRGGRRRTADMRPAPPRPDEKTPAPFLPTVTCHMIIPDQTGTLLLYYIIVILYITSPGAALLCASILHPHALSAAPSHAREAARYIYIWLRQGPPAPSAAGASSLQPPPPPPPPQPQPQSAPLRRLPTPTSPGGPGAVPRGRPPRGSSPPLRRCRCRYRCRCRCRCPLLLLLLPQTRRRRRRRPPPAASPRPAPPRWS